MMQVKELKQTIFTSTEMVSELLYRSLGGGISDSKQDIAIYMAFFVKITYKNIGKKEMSYKEFIQYIRKNESAKKIFNYLRYNEKNMQEKGSAIKVESLLFWYQVTSTRKKLERIKSMCEHRHKENRLLKNYILKMYNKKTQQIKLFYKENEREILEFIKNNCPKIYQKYQSDKNYDLFQQVSKIIYKRNEFNNIAP